MYYNEEDPCQSVEKLLPLTDFNEREIQMAFEISSGGFLESIVTTFTFKK